MNKRTKIIALVTAVVASFALMGAGWGRGHGHHHFKRLAASLDFTDQQEDLAVEIGKDLHKRKAVIAKAGLDDMIRLAEEIEKPNPNQKALHDIADKKMDAMRGLVHHGIDRVLALHKTFSADQRNEAAKKVRRFHDHMSDWE